MDIVLSVMALVKHYRPEPLTLRHLPPCWGLVGIAKTKYN